MDCTTGIPLTDKKLSTAFVVTSGHDVSAVDWDAMRGFQTIVFLMAGNSIAGNPRKCSLPVD
jgi:siroheme synthase